ncbi:2-C-methyl-D-erythritol 2,4-cyclodiphosphate synthase [Alcanivorax profundi]|uniref:2-C-methyl-D-erythritol 2,4-cyclodiphosphate synthase n=1 Tax=Alcanivorax profundi TaxID=2338368 RepID=A0A418Y415_9GAMM|nr:MULTISPECIES: 2-C-methyl-D-erythritol 2,4-cyclodiphosphate synthase [Alcanivorax]RJG20294.1 2-C-methyl-D-erythritol 2,4-cyclodiphosphate synthase [Alcanivorax profundi]
MRIGQGFDVHAFEPGDHVMLCGLAIPHNQGLKAHSDGDVALHALADALLGALALGDIGHYFPDTDPQWKGADSATLLKAIYADLLKAGWQLGNADLTIICQAPKLAPHITPMRQRIADILDCTIDQVSVKATTTEKLGFTGRKEGIAVQAAVLIESR